MAKYEFKLPHMGESVAEATITSWLKEVGDTIEADDALVEVATDKVDSEIPCEVSGVITDILFKKDDVVQVGQVMAIIETEPNSSQENDNQEVVNTSEPSTENIQTEDFKQPDVVQTTETTSVENQEPIESSIIEKEVQNIVSQSVSSSEGERFYSPLVKTIAQQENISLQELDQIQGSGLDGRVTKYDILAYIEQRGQTSPKVEKQESWQQPEVQTPAEQAVNHFETTENISVQEPEQNIVNQEVTQETEPQNFYQETEQTVENQEAQQETEQQNFYQEPEQTIVNQEVAQQEVEPQNSYQEPEQTIENQEVAQQEAEPQNFYQEPEQTIENQEVAQQEVEPQNFYQEPEQTIENQEISSEENLQQEATKEDPSPVFAEKPAELHIKTPTENKPEEKPAPTYTPSQIDDVEVIEMTRMGKLISKYMVDSKRISPHVQSFTEVDVTRIWNWRNKVKKQFEAREGEKFTFTPIFIEAVAKALRDFPMMNVSTDGERIFKKKHINIGMATALPNGDLIVPVIKNADQLSLLGLAKSVNDLAKRARENKLKPDEIKGGTYTVTNIGSFGNVFGTPIINQPEVGILAIGAIQKMPAVIETPEGDVLGIRYKLILSHSYDHRVVNGALGGMFVQRVAEYLEKWDMEREV